MPNLTLPRDLQSYPPFVNPPLAEQVKQALIGVGSQIGPTPAALEMARQAYFLADYLVKRFEEQNHLPEPIACSPGCCYCCCNQVEVTPPEALLISHYVHWQYAPQEKRHLQERLVRQLAWKAGKSKTELARLRRKLPCPLLKKGRCTIYPVRPLVCRAMHAFSSQHCREALRSGDQTEVPFYAHRHEIILSISLGVRQACRALQLPDKPADLVAALYQHYTADGSQDRWLDDGEESPER